MLRQQGAIHQLTQTILYVAVICNRYVRIPVLHTTVSSAEPQPLPPYWSRLIPRWSGLLLVASQSFRPPSPFQCNNSNWRWDRIRAAFALTGPFCHGGGRERLRFLSELKSQQGNFIIFRLLYRFNKACSHTISHIGFILLQQPQQAPNEQILLSVETLLSEMTASRLKWHISWSNVFTMQDVMHTVIISSPLKLHISVQSSVVWQRPWWVMAALCNAGPYLDGLGFY